jgi:hypothetical protein
MGLTNFLLVDLVRLNVAWQGVECQSRCELISCHRLEPLHDKVDAVCNLGVQLQVAVVSGEW